MRILLLEQQNLLASTISAMIEYAGHHATVIRTPDQAELQLKDGNYDALIIGQPRGGFCPYAFAETAKAVRPDMCVVFARASHETQADGHSFDAVLNAPYSLTQLLCALSSSPK